MGEFPTSVQDVLDRLGPTDVLDIFVIAVLIYAVFLFFRGTAAIALLRGAAMLLLGAVILAQALNLEVLDFLIRNSLFAIIIAIPIVFQPEIRRALERVGRTGIGVWAKPGHDVLVDTVTLTAMELSKLRHGALIVFERETGLQRFVETGVPVDATPSVELLEGIFYPNSPLHDGAVIVRENRIVAAACMLPSSETRLPGEMGMRHLAALGITEETDAISLVVSEETGTVALVADGRIYARLDEPRLRNLLGRLLVPATRNGAGDDL